MTTTVPTEIDADSDENLVPQDETDLSEEQAQANLDDKPVDKNEISENGNEKNKPAKKSSKNDSATDDDDQSSNEKKNKPLKSDDNKDDDKSSKKKQPCKCNRNDDEDDEKDVDSEYSEDRPTRRRKFPDYIGHMNIYLRNSSRHGAIRFQKFRFPVARYDFRRYPSLGPLISFLPWLPIFVERQTKQTIIYSPTGGVYIIPPLINFYGKVYSVGELIVSGYASLVHTGTPPVPNVDIAPLVQPNKITGPKVPTLNPTTGGFNGGVPTNFHKPSGPKYPTSYQVNSNSQKTIQYA